jgi:hypothetical protein
MAMVMATAMAMETIKKAKQLEMMPIRTLLQNGKRIVIFTFVLFLAWQSIIVSIANITREKTPDAALKIAPKDAGALAIRNDMHLSRNKTDLKWRINFRDALASYRGDGLNSRAVRQLGFLAENRGDFVNASALIKMAEKMSRRDVGAQLWLVNQLAERNDINGALRHIDTGLRTSSESQALLFPILTKALSDPGFQAAFAPYIKASPSWISSFIDYALTKNNNLEILSQSIVLAGGLPSNKVNQKLDTALLEHLAANGNYSEAKLYFASKKGADLSLLTNAEFKPISIDPRNGPMAWQTFQTVDVEGAIEQGDIAGTYQLNVTIGSDQRRVAAQKLLYLKAGNYQLRAKHTFLNGGKDTAAHWDLHCLHGQDFMTASSAIFNNDVSDKNAVILVVPSNCPVQLLKLTAVGGSEAVESNIIVSHLQFSSM